ncbi:sulfurtransferase [Kurthia sibirica]|nr:sulfurtransferase [Kurthia sibirica]
MVPAIIIIVIVILLFLKFKPAKGITQISTNDLKNTIAQNGSNKQYIDVRTPREYKARNIKQFKNIPLGSGFASLQKDKEVIVICQSGMRSMQATKKTRF